MASPIQQRLLDLGTDIAAVPPEDLAFQHTILCQTSLPATRPAPDCLVWERRQGRATLLVEAGKVINPRTGHFEQLALPYGPKARLLLMHLNSEAVRRQSPVIPVEDTMTAFFRRLMGRTQDGRQAKMLKEQLSALAAAQFRIGVTSASGEGALQVDTKVVGAFNLWFEKDENQRILWPSELKLSLDYFDSLNRFAVPLDERAYCRAGALGRGPRYVLLAGAAAAPHPGWSLAVHPLDRPTGTVRPGLRAVARLPGVFQRPAAAGARRLPGSPNRHRLARHSAVAVAAAGEEALSGGRPGRRRACAIGGGPTHRGLSGHRGGAGRMCNRWRPLGRGMCNRRRTSWWTESGTSPFTARCRRTGEEAAGREAWGLAGR